MEWPISSFGGIYNLYGMVHPSTDLHVHLHRFRYLMDGYHSSFGSRDHTWGRQKSKLNLLSLLLWHIYEVLLQQIFIQDTLYMKKYARTQKHIP